MSPTFSCSISSLLRVGLLWLRWAWTWKLAQLDLVYNDQPQTPVEAPFCNQAQCHNRLLGPPALSEMHQTRTSYPIDATSMWSRFPVTPRAKAWKAIVLRCCSNIPIMLIPHYVISLLMCQCCHPRTSQFSWCSKPIISKCNGGPCA